MLTGLVVADAMRRNVPLVSAGASAAEAAEAAAAAVAECSGFAGAGALCCALIVDPKDSSLAGVAGRCRLTVSKPELKARLVSELETEM